MTWSASAAQRLTWYRRLQGVVGDVTCHAANVRDLNRVQYGRVDEVIAALEDAKARLDEVIEDMRESEGRA